MEKLKKNGSPEEQAMASTALEKFRPLVEMMLFDRDGGFLDRRSMNEDILFPFPGCKNPDKELLDYFTNFLNTATGPT